MTWHVEFADGKPWRDLEHGSAIHLRTMYFDTQEQARSYWEDYPVPAVLVHDSGLREEVRGC